MLKKLFTREDAHYHHMHKILGFSVLCNFFYRLCNMNTHTLGFNVDDDYYIWTIVLHAILHVSSFQFVISPKRNATYNIIWPEMRWHSLIFAYRSLFIMLMFRFMDAANDMFVFYRFGIVILTMLAADTVTYLIPPSNNTTTMRGNPFPQGTGSIIINSINLFYSISQIFATLHILFAPTPFYVFLTLIPIQTAPFGMTLQRKGFISQYGWHVSYTAAILTNYIYSAIYIYEPLLMWRYMIFFAICRFKLKINKYILWSVIATHYIIKFNETDDL